MVGVAIRIHGSCSGCVSNKFSIVRQPEHDMNNKRVKIIKFKYDLISNRVTRLDTCNMFINFVI